MKQFKVAFAVLATCFATALTAQNPELSISQEPTLKINSRAVLVDVVVTDHNGNPVKGLKQEDFKVLEEGKPQSIGYFEEHTAEDLAKRSQELEIPSLPPNVFSNYSPLGTPPAVNVL